MRRLEQLVADRCIDRETYEIAQVFAANYRLASGWVGTMEQDLARVPLSTQAASQWLRDVISALGDAQSRLLVDHCVRDVSFKKIGERLDIDHHAAKARIIKALNNLANLTKGEPN
jgi:DNA-directed RNA polymerase specialized sigma24 family protein